MLSLREVNNETSHAVTFEFVKIALSGVICERETHSHPGQLILGWRSEARLKT